MEELDDLKSIWKSRPGNFLPKDESEIAAMLKGSSKSIVHKLKRSVWIELSITLLAGVGLLIYALTLPSGALKWTSISILIIFVGYTIYYIKKIKLLNKFNTTTENVRVSLEQLISNLSSYLKFYKRSYTVLYPVYFVLGILFSGIERGTTQFLEMLTQPKTIAYLVLIGIVFFFSSTSLVDWLLKKLYGNHLEKLQRLLNDLRT